MSVIHLNQLPEQPAVKLVTAVVAALSITFLSFAIMQQLIKANQGARPEAVAYEPVTLFVQTKETDPVVKDPMPKMPPPQPRDLPKPPIEPVDSTNISPGPVVVDAPSIPSAKGGPMQQGQTDRSATPLVRVEPRYPIDAARDGITGWVKLGFNIDETGNVTDVEVLAAEPGNIFNREAIRALRRWKYQPQIVDGKAIKQLNLQVQLDFSLQTD
jgi:periplasmic protein TonB